MKSKFDIHNEIKKWKSLLSLECDNPEDELLEKTEKQIVSNKERDKVDVHGCEDITDYFSIPQYKFPYEDYRIIGDTSEIDNIIQKSGLINIDIADITSTLSTNTLNYVTVGIGDNISDAMKQSVDNLPVNRRQVKKMLFQILIPNDYKQDLSTTMSVADFISKCNNETDVFFGLAFDESLTDNIKVVLIASSK